MVTAAAAIIATPPTTPPAIAPVWLAVLSVLPLEDVDVGGAVPESPLVCPCDVNVSGYFRSI
jgi:hypothetical protein